MRTFSLRSFFTCLLLLVGPVIFSQQSILRLQKSPKGFYLEHKVMPKQSLFSVGRIYMVHPHFLASYNGLDANKGLQIDQVIRIPLSDTNFYRKQGEGVPIYLYASTDDVLSDIAQFVGAEIKDIQCWNKFDGIDVKKGTTWVVGFLASSDPAFQRVNLICGSTQSDTATIKLPVPSTIVVNSSFFQSEYVGQIQNTPQTQQLSLICATFKSESGWKDGKHYLLIDNLIPGTVVRLYNPLSKKEAFAKVLGEMPRIKQNEGLDIRISDATASYLGISTHDRFALQVSY